MPHTLRFWAALFMLTSAILCYGRDQRCPELSQEARTRVAAYVSDKYKVAPDVTITDAGTVAGSCFRRLVIDVAAPKRSLQLFLAPGGRFLSESLLDLNSSPRQERERVARETEAALLKDASPSEGPENARVTVVVFSDFECPFWQKLLGTLVRNTSGGSPGCKNCVQAFAAEHPPLGPESCACGDLRK